jgi:hypothetical protein
MARIEGRELEEEELSIPPLQASFPRSTKVIRSGITDIHINTLYCQEEGQIEEAKVEIKDEALPKLSNHATDEHSIRAFL